MKNPTLAMFLAASMLFISGMCAAQMQWREQLPYGYSVDRKAVYYRDYMLEIDPEGFEVLGEHWVKNSRHVFFMFTPRNGQEIRSGYWSEGDEGDFYRLNSLLGFLDRPVDPESFRLMTDYLAVDKSQVYYFNTRPPVDSLSVLSSADPASIEVINEDYARDRNNVYYTRRNFGPCTIEKADPNTFSALSERYSKDENHAFYECLLIKNADANTFQVTSGFVAADSKHVFRSGKLVSNADPATFDRLKHRFGNLNFYADDEHVYYLKSIVDDADPDTFEVIASYFVKDHQHAFFCAKRCHVIPGADVETFHAAPVKSTWANASVYARDESRVFFCAELKDHDPCAPLPHSDPISFEYIGQYFSRDKSNVFFREAVVKGADAKTFEIFEADEHRGIYRARDKNNVYIIRRIGAPNFYEYGLEGPGQS
jgi:hypothetical protein